MILRSHEAWREAAEAGGERAACAAAAVFDGLQSAVEALLSNLYDLDFPPVPGIIVPEDGLDERIDRLQARVGGTVPPVLSEFWRRVGGISVVDLDSYAHTDFWEAAGVEGWDGCSDGVYVDSCSPGWFSFALGEHADFYEDPSEPPPYERFLMSLSPDAYHKDKFSGGDSYGIEIDDGWFATWQNFCWPTSPHRPVSAPPWPCDFVGYLRTSILECAGFPGLFDVPAFEPFRERLLRNVEPF